MRLKQQTYRLTSKENVRPTIAETNSLLLVVNSMPTNISIKDLFHNGKVNNGYIKGYSILEQLKEKDEHLALLEHEGKEVVISFTTGKTDYYIKNLENPTFQAEDEEVEDDIILDWLSKLQIVEAKVSSSATDESQPDEAVDSTSQTAQPQEEDEPASEGVGEQPEPEATEEEEAEEEKPEDQPDETSEELQEFISDMTEQEYAITSLNDGYHVFSADERVPIIIHENSADNNIEEFEITDFNEEGETIEYEFEKGFLFVDAEGEFEINSTAKIEAKAEAESE